MADRRVFNDDFTLFTKYAVFDSCGIFHKLTGNEKRAVETAHRIGGFYTMAQRPVALESPVVKISTLQVEDPSSPGPSDIKETAVGPASIKDTPPYRGTKCHDEQKSSPAPKHLSGE